ncbi:glycoside hydrolase family 36 protein [Streptomyces paludis]|uniref:Alpha-galactosidase n=1 Tax=Streptomyces paludis TaxID=2282738 RepID=A0A345HZH9_9ACTN|nr:glycoside hydrolase family 36 protein [Streptomyces paludis]AXG82103.1 alpha-galactosidase [Streptomyces paludis]
MTEPLTPITSWGPEALTLHLAHGADLVPRLAVNAAPGRAALPLVEVELAGQGRSGTSGKRHVDGAVSRRLRYDGHDADGERLTVRTRDPETGLRAATHFRRTGTLPTVSTWTELTAGDRTADIENVSSLVLSGVAALLGAPGRWERDVRLWTADNPWSGEYRWQGVPLGAAGLIDTGMTRFGQTGSKNRVARTSTGSWPSSEQLPMGWLAGPDAVLAWQIEHNGSWHTEIADRFDEIYLLLSGPGRREHQWSVRLAPGESFTTVPVTFTLAPGRDAALAALTGHRRAVRRPHPDTTELPVVFNDFMNCLMGDPTTEKLLPLVAAAAAAGCEYFCVDAGWYDDERAGDGPGGVPGWWDAVGAWEPAPSRFPGGLAEVTDAIKAAGMIPGLWLEPEVVGVRSPLAASLPDEAFFRRDGTRITEWGRHQLDLRHPAAVAHLDDTVDRLVGEFGLGYLKLDYNIDIGAGTDSGPHGPGHGLLEHNRAYLRWLDGVHDRHPGLVLEGCAAGGMRIDHATLAHVPVQSLSDQQDELLIAAIAAAAPTAVPPEQGAVWAYPYAGQSDEEIAFTMVSALLGRVHLSGRIDLLAPDQLALVAEALTAYGGYRRELARALPSWPLGLPGWRDDWLALALDTGTETLLAVWRRTGADAVREIPVPAGTRAVVPVFPRGAPGEAVLDRETGRLRITLPSAPSARLLRLPRAVSPLS